MMNMAAGAVNGANNVNGTGISSAAKAGIRSGFQYGPVTINGGVGVVALARPYVDPVTAAVETVEAVKEISAEVLANAHITLCELKEKVAPTGKMKLPSFKQLTEMKATVIAEKILKNAMVTVFENGFACYEQENAHTVMAVDRLGGYRYDFVNGENSYVPEEVFDDMEWSVRLVMEGEKHIEENRARNASRNETETFEVDGFDTEIGMMIDFLEEKNQESLADRELKRLYAAIGKLTERQQEVIQLYYFKEMTQQEIAEELGLSRRTVRDSLEGALKKLKKVF